MDDFMIKIIVKSYNNETSKSLYNDLRDNWFKFGFNEEIASYAPLTIILKKQTNNLKVMSEIYDGIIKPKTIKACAKYQISNPKLSFYMNHNEN